MNKINRDWLSGGKNLSEILLGYTQHHGGNNEYSYRNLFRRMDKICHSDKPHCTVTSGACGLYRNPMLCERLAGRTGILLNKIRAGQLLKLLPACISYGLIPMFFSPCTQSRKHRYQRFSFFSKAVFHFWGHLRVFFAVH